MSHGWRWYHASGFLTLRPMHRGWGLGDDGNSILHHRLVSILGMLTSICGRMECPSEIFENQMESPSCDIFQVFQGFSRLSRLSLTTYYYVHDALCNALFLVSPNSELPFVTEHHNDAIMMQSSCSHSWLQSWRQSWLQSWPQSWLQSCCSHGCTHAAIMLQSWLQSWL